jgi:DNA-binding beta-propeller fold protein YncE
MRPFQNLNAAMGSVLALMAVLVVGSAAYAQAAPFEIWVSDQERDRIVVLDGETLEVTAQIPLDEDGEPSTSKPHMILFSSDGRYAYVALVAAGAVAVLDAERREIVQKIPTGQKAHAPIPSPDGRRLFVVNVGEATVTEILTDTRRGSFRVGRTIPTGPRPICLMFTADGERAYVTLGGDPEAEDAAMTGGIEVIDVARGEVIKRFENTGKNGCGLVRSPQDERIMFADVGRPLNRLYAFDTESDELLFEADTGVEDAHGLWVSPQGEVWIFGRRDGRVALFEPGPDGFLPMGDLQLRETGLDLVDASPDGRRLFVAVRGPAGGGETPGVAVIDVIGRQEMRFVPLAGDPHGLAVRPTAMPPAARPPLILVLLAVGLLVALVLLRR